MSITVKELADVCSASIVGGNPAAELHSAADIFSAQAGQVTQLTNTKYAKFIANTMATACFIGENFQVDEVPAQTSLLVCADPEMCFVKAVAVLHPAKVRNEKIAAQAVIDSSVKLGAGVHVAPFAVIERNVVVGDNSVILAGVCIGENVKIGRNCQIHPYAVIYDDVVLGDNVIIHAGTIIGADGFGYKFRQGSHIKVPQVGNVVIEDNVEIGANTCVDRGALGSTVIGQGSKIDNLVQIGHNNKVGKHVIMCGQTGVSGSCKIEDYAILAGSVGVADHVTIGKGAVIMARSGVSGNVEPGSQMFGSPAKDKKTAYREQFAISRLPDLIKQVKKLEEELKCLKIKDVKQSSG